MNRLIDLIEEKRGSLISLCQQFSVRQIELFGSAASERFDPSSSDLDFLVAFEDLPPSEYSEAYFGLMEALQELFQRPIDLVVLGAITNPYFLQEIGKTRTLLYAA